MSPFASLTSTLIPHHTHKAAVSVYMPRGGLLQQIEREKLWPSQLFPMLQSPLLSNREQNKSTSLPSNPFHLLPSSTAALPHYKPLSLPLHTHTRAHPFCPHTLTPPTHRPYTQIPSPLSTFTWENIYSAVKVIKSQDRTVVETVDNFCSAVRDK